MTDNRITIVPGIPQLVNALAIDIWPRNEHDSMDFLRRHGFIVRDETREWKDTSCFGEMDTPLPNITGHWTVTDGILESISMFPYETVPTDRLRLSAAFALLNGELTELFGEPVQDVGSFDAPKSLWEPTGVTVSVDCHWADGRIGIIQLSIECSTR